MVSERSGTVGEISPLEMRHGTRIDLHTHTTASDGTLSPAELVECALQRGISVLAITDHDTLDGVAEARLCRQLGDPQSRPRLVSGVELSTTVTGAEVHILGYFVDESDTGLRETLAGFAQGRRKRIELVIRKLQAIGIPLDTDAILTHAEAGSIGRPHVARALVDLGVVTSTDEAFDRYLRRDRPGWVPRDPFSPQDAVRLLADHGAIPVLAHPFSTKAVEETVKSLLPAGLVGMEVFYGEYDARQRQELLAVADAFDLAPTGGSDFHGPRFREGRELGSVDIPGFVWERLQHVAAERGITA